LQSALSMLSKLIATEHFHIVIVDYELPDMTGAQLAQEIRAVDRKLESFCFPGGRICLLESWHLSMSISLKVRFWTPLSKPFAAYCSLRT